MFDEFNWIAVFIYFAKNMNSARIFNEFPLETETTEGPGEAQVYCQR